TCLNCGNEFAVPQGDKVIEVVKTADPDRPAWSAWVGIGMWLFSVALIFLASVPATLSYMLWRHMHDLPKLTKMPSLEEAPQLVIFLLLGTLGAQLLTILLAYMLVTKLSDRPFLEALGWQWHQHFRLPHTIVLTGLIFVLVAIIGSKLPNAKTDLERVLES